MTKKHNKIKKLDKMPNEKDFSDNKDLVFKPRNLNQKKAYNSFGKNKITIINAPFGTGKTFLASFFALKQLEEGLQKKVYLLRPIAVPEEEYMGYLSGDLKQKIEPFMIPYIEEMSDIVGTEKVSKLIKDELIVPSSMAYLRGRNFKNAVVIVDEMQNATIKCLMTTLSRIDDDCKVICLGDIMQRDLPKHKKSSMDYLDYFANSKDIEIINFSEKDIVRSEIVTELFSIYKRIEQDEISNQNIINEVYLNEKY